MSTTSTFFKTSAIVSTALLSLLGACAIDDPIDYTTDGYTAGPQGGGSGDESSGDSSTGATGTVEWIRQPWTGSLSNGFGITTDSSGNVYVTGDSSGGNPDFFKYNSDGVKQWTGSDEGGTAIASDRSGNLYVTGMIHSVTDSDIFVRKYNSAGVRQWAQVLGTSSGDESWGITTDSSGNVYVTGHTMGSLDNNTNAGSGSDLFVVKYDSDGNKQWTQQMGIDYIDSARGITTDSSGNVYVTGHTWGSLGGFDTESYDFFIVKYDSAGVKQWSKQLGTWVDDSAYGITSDSNGNVYVAGSTNGILDGTGGSHGQSIGGSDLFIVKYDSAGVKQWTQQMLTSSEEWVTSITTDTSGNVYVAGSTDGDLDGNTNAGYKDLFVVKYDSSGAKQWTQQLGSPSRDEANGITTDSSGNVYVTGYGGVLDGSSNGGSDLFVVKFK